MLETYFRDLTQEGKTRKALIELRKALKEESQSLTADQLAQVRAQLTHEDPKVRKNAALILGEQCDQESLDALTSAYEGEDTLFVRADYLEAISHLQYREHLGRYKNRMAELMAQKPDESSQKHRNAEIRALRALILQVEKTKAHRFAGWKTKSDIVSTTGTIC